MPQRSHSFPRRPVQHQDYLQDVAERATEAARKSRERIRAAKRSRAEANAAWVPNGLANPAVVLLAFTCAPASGPRRAAPSRTLVGVLGTDLAAPHSRLA